MTSDLKQIERTYASLLAHVDRTVLTLIESVDPRDLAVFSVALRGDVAAPRPSDIFYYFIEREKKRFVKALDVIRRERSAGTVCDFGCFLPYLPIALSELGYDVKIVENYRLYGASLRDAIFKAAASSSIAVHDLDILADDFSSVGQSDVVLLMAVVEHLNGSPRHLMRKVHDAIAPGGFLLFEVPNIADLTKRLQLLLGRSPLPDYPVYFESEYPFMGHNREMTVDEVRYLLEHTGFAIRSIECYDYGRPAQDLKARVAELLKRVVPLRYQHQSILARAYALP